MIITNKNIIIWDAAEIMIQVLYFEPNLISSNRQGNIKLAYVI